MIGGDTNGGRRMKGEGGGDEGVAMDGIRIVVLGGYGGGVGFGGVGMGGLEIEGDGGDIGELAGRDEGGYGLGLEREGDGGYGEGLRRGEGGVGLLECWSGWGELVRGTGICFMCKTVGKRTSVYKCKRMHK